MTNITAPVRRLALAAGLVTVALISCGREVTGPGKAPVNAFKRFASFAFAPQYETAVPSTALRAALLQVAFEKVRITLRREDGTIALDTVVNFPAGADSLTLSFNVPLPANAPAGGVPLSLSLGYVNAAGDTVFKGGPLPVTVTPSTGGAPPPPVQVPVHYTGTGANATGVVITPKVVNGTAGQLVSFSAVAVGANGQTIAGTPIVFTSANPDVILFSTPTSGSARLIGRGTTTVSAQLLTGPEDVATVTVTLPASRLTLTSGGNQSAPAGTNVPLPIVARVTASDGIGVGGVTVNFAVTGGGGSVAAGTAVSASDGSVSTSWTLGVTPGAQSLTLTAAGLSGSPLVVNATALSVTPTKLAVTTQPASAKAGGTLGNVTVAAQDANGITVATFAGEITVAIGTNPAAATLSGTTTMKAVNGIATFSNLSLDKPATGYTLAFASSGLAGATSSAFDVTVGTAAKLSIGTLPAFATAGSNIMPAVVVRAQDSMGNLVAGFTGRVTVALGANPKGAVLGGTLSRDAVAGVATFNDLAINVAAVGYTITATSPSLTASTSSAFTVLPGDPVDLQVVRGDAQSRPAGTMLDTIVVRLVDAFANSVPGRAVSFSVTSGGGSASALSSTTDVQGEVRVLWTIGFGPQALTASFAGMPLLTIKATGTAGAATQLVIISPGLPAGVSGIPATVVVHATDAAGNLATSFTGVVTAAIASGPPGATVTGPTTATAVAGVATFSGVSLDKAGSYTVTFSATGLTSVTSPSFVVSAGAATQLVLTTSAAGAAVGAAFTTQPVVAVRDAAGNTVTTDNSTVVTMTVSAGATVTAPTATAASGVATFSGAALSGTAGTSYTLTFAATGLTSATQNITPTVGAVSTVTISPTSVTLAVGQTQQLTAALTDAGGNTVSGTVTWASSSPTTAAVSSSGLVTAVGVGSATIAATSGGKSGTITATVTAGAATQLVISQQPPTTSVAGVAFTPALTVVAKDAGGNVAAGFTGTVSVVIGTNPSAGTLSGTLSAAAVGGIATFSNLSIDKTGTGYTLVFSASGLTGATSTTVSITPAAASQIAADSGQSQTGPAGQPLPMTLVVKVADAYGNKVSGASVTWAVAGGGGSLANTSAVTDASGKARAQWTLGLTLGTQSVTATSAGLTGSPVTFSATGNAVAYSKLWTGATSTDWNTATNWSPAGVPAATDSVQIDLVTNQPTLAASTTIAGLTTANGTTLSIGTFDLSVAGTVNTGASSAVSGTGKLMLTGASGTIVGPSFPYVKVLGSYSLSGSVGFFSSVEVASGSLNTNGHTANITGDLITSGSGTIAMTSASDVFNVSGNVSLGGGNVTLSIGELRVGGNFTQTAGTFAQTGGFTQFVGTAIKAISFSDITATSYFKRVVANGAGTINLSTAIRIAGGLELLSGAGHIVGVGKVVRAMGLTIDLAVPRQLQVDTLDLWMSGTVSLPSAFQIAVVNVTGAGVNLGNAVSLDGQLRITGNGILGMNGFNVTVTADLVTADNGRLQMNGETMTVNGTVYFGGGNMSTDLNGGTLSIDGSFWQTNGANTNQTFVGGGTHVTQFTGSLQHNVSFADPTQSGFANLTNAGTGTLNFSTDVRAIGLAKVESGAGAIIGGAGHKFYSGLGINDVSGNGTKFSADSLILYRNATVQLPTTVNAPIKVTGTTVTLSNGFTAASSLEVNNGRLDLNGQAVTVTTNFATLGSGTLQMKNASNLDNLIVNGSISFAGGSTSGLLTNGKINVRGNFSQSGNAQAFAASGSHIVHFDGTAAANQSITFANIDSSFSTACSASCFANVSATKLNGQGGILISTAMKTVGNIDFSGTADSVSVGLPALPGRIVVAGGSFTAGANARRFSRVAVGGTFSNGASVTIDTLIYTGASQTLNPAGLGGVSNVRVSGSGNTLIAAGSGTFSGAVVIDGSAAVLEVTGSGTPAQLFGTVKTQNGGRLRMTDVTDTLYVNDIDFSGGSTAGMLTAGTLQVVGNFASTGAAFDASGSHTVAMLSSSGAQTLTGDPGSTTVGFQNLTFAGTAGKTVTMSGSYAFNVKGALRLRSGSAPVTGTGQIWMKSGSAVYDSTAAGNSLTIARLYVAGVMVLPAKLAVGDLMIANGIQQLTGPINTTGTVTVNGTGAQLDLNGKRLRLTGASAGFSTTNAGTLKMANPADSLTVENANSMTFAGGSTDGLLTDGTIIATGNFTQGTAGDPAAFAATGNHETIFGGTSGTTVKFGNPGSTTTTSHFARLKLANDTSATGTTLASDVYAINQLTSSGFLVTKVVRDAGYATSAAPTLHVADVSSTNSKNFDRVMLRIYNATASTTLQSATFQNFANYTGETQLTVEGSGTITTIKNLFFSTSTANTYRYVSALNTGSGLTLTLTGMSPSVHGGLIATAGTPVATISWSP